MSLTTYIATYHSKCDVCPETSQRNQSSPFPTHPSSPANPIDFLPGPSLYDPHPTFLSKFLQESHEAPAYLPFS